MFAQETAQNFADYDLAFSDLEKRLPAEEEQVIQDGITEQSVEPIGTSISDIDGDGENVISPSDLKNIIKQELGNI